jgi:large subunit ribosomal protein L4
VPLYSLVDLSAKKASQHGAQSNSNGETDSLVELNAEVFGHPIRRDIVHLCLTHHMDGQRQGSASTKTRYEVRGSRRKLFAQKGMGKARVGDAASPIRRGGGRAFGPKPRDFSTGLPRKVRFMGMRVAWSAKVREGQLMAVESLNWPGTQTKLLRARLDQMGWGVGRTLFVTGQQEFPDGFRLSCGNLAETEMKRAAEVNIHDALKYPRVVMDLSALEYFEERLKRGTTMAMPDLRKKRTRSRREERRANATEKANLLAQQLVHLQYERRFGQALPPIPRRFIEALE